MKKLLLLPKRILISFSKLRRRNKIFIIVVIVIIFIILWRVLSPSSPSYTSTKVSRGNVTETVSETGNVVSSGIVDMYSPTTGIVEEVYIENGESVSIDQELFKVKSTATEQEKSAALANYLTSKNTLDAAQANAYTLRSTKDTAWKEFYDLAIGSEYQNSDGTPRDDRRNSSAAFQSSQADWLASEAKYNNQQAVVAQAQASTASTWLLYQATQDMVVKSTSEGVVANLSVSPGAQVSAKTATIQKPVLTITTPSVSEVVIPLSEADILKVKEGQEAKAEINAASNKVYKGIVKRVDRIGREDNGVIIYNAYIEILENDGNLLTGMTADIEITTNRVENVLILPNAAIKPYQGGRAVRVDKNGEIKYVPVQIGIKGNENTQIVSGLNFDQNVITTLSNEQLKRPGLFGN